MLNQDTIAYINASEAFGRAYRLGLWRRFWMWLTRRPARLVAYDTAVEPLGICAERPAGMQEVPLDQIVGSVGRADDFTRDFLPRRLAAQERWVGIMMAVLRMNGLPPVRLYRVGEDYFVLDGHHRVAVYHRLGAKTITAKVTRIDTRHPYPGTRSGRLRPPHPSPAVV